METSALAPIQTSTGSDGVGATRASLTAKRPDDDTTSPARSRRMIESDSSNADGRVVRRAPIAANWLSSSPRPHWRMKRPRASAASVPTCSATRTGFQSGRRKRQPAGLSPHSASSRPSMGTFW